MWVTLSVKQKVKCLARGAVRVSGASSWYGGPNDAADNNRPALAGASNRTPGIAIYNQHTLGGYWVVHAAGKAKVIRQTDIGPSPSVKPKIDYNPPAAALFGWKATDSEFPAPHTTAVYIGKSPARARRVARSLDGKQAPAATGKPQKMPRAPVPPQQPQRQPQRQQAPVQGQSPAVQRLIELGQIAARISAGQSV